MSMPASNTYLASLGYEDPQCYRRTPEGQPTVGDLVRPGMTVRTSYNSGGIVIEVQCFDWTSEAGERLPNWTIVYVPEKVYGRHTNHDRCWLNELVAVDGKILKLFENNEDFVEIIDTSIAVAWNRQGQGLLF